MSTPLPQSLVPLLRCPLCNPPDILQNPVTLHCGHTLCATHVTSPSCPIPSCALSLPSDFTPAASSVTFRPAPRPSTPSKQSEYTRTDIVVTKIIALVRNTDHKTENSSPPPSPSTSCCSYDSSHSDANDPPSLSGSPHSSPRPSPPRPRKRRRRNSPEHHQDTLSDPLQRFHKQLNAELCCEICFTLFYQPVTTPCQHTFCSKCLQRSLDHSLLCPLCRCELPGYAYFQEHPHNKLVLSIILKAYPDSYAARGHAIAVEERDARLDTPIFVAQLSFPGMPTLLHFFEPRYRLMLRRCLEAPSPVFGMIMPPRAAPISGIGVDGGCEFGTMLEIKSVQMLPDGRSMVETWGTHRFRILERGTLDGYMIGRVERIDDYDDDLDEWAFESLEEICPASGNDSPFRCSRISSPLLSRIPGVSHTDPPSTPPPPLTTAALLAKCHAFLDQLREGTAPWVVQRLNNTVGAPPSNEDPGAFSFWMALVLPIDEHEKAKLLPLKSARLRLKLIVHWIDQLNSNWWFSSGCVVI